MDSLLAKLSFSKLFFLVAFILIALLAVLNPSEVSAEVELETFNGYTCPTFRVDGSPSGRLDLLDTHSIDVTILSQGREIRQNLIGSGAVFALFISKNGSDWWHIIDMEIESQGIVSVDLSLSEIWRDSDKYKWENGFRLLEWLDDLAILDFDGDQKRDHVDLQIRLVDRATRDGILPNDSKICSFMNIPFDPLEDSIPGQDLSYVRETGCCIDHLQCKRAFGYGSVCGGEGATVFGGGKKETGDGRARGSSDLDDTGLNVDVDCDTLARCNFRKQPSTGRGNDYPEPTSVTAAALRQPGQSCKIEPASNDSTWSARVNISRNQNAQFDRCIGETFCFEPTGDVYGVCAPACGVFGEPGDSIGNFNYSTTWACLEDEQRYEVDGSVPGQEDFGGEKGSEYLESVCPDFDPNTYEMIFFYEELFEPPLSIGTFSAACGGTDCKVVRRASGFKTAAAINSTRLLYGIPATTVRTYECYAPTKQSECPLGDACTISAQYDSTNNRVDIRVDTLCIDTDEGPRDLSIGYTNLGGQSPTSLPVSSTNNSTSFTTSLSGIPAQLSGTPTIEVVDTSLGAEICSTTYIKDIESLIPDDGEEPVVGGTTGPITVDPGESDAFGVRNCPGQESVLDANGDPTGETAYFDEFYECRSCILLGGTWTGLGCLSTTPSALFANLARIGLGIMGGVALLRLIYLGFLYQTGDEGKIAEARKGVLSTLGAIVLILFSVLILQVIGANLLDIVPEGFFITSQG